MARPRVGALLHWRVRRHPYHVQQTCGYPEQNQCGVGSKSCQETEHAHHSISRYVASVPDHPREHGYLELVLRSSQAIVKQSALSMRLTHTCNCGRSAALRKAAMPPRDVAPLRARALAVAETDAW
eukprot:2967431-Pyramimonas_sp.AAC.1